MRAQPHPLSAISQAPAQLRSLDRWVCLGDPSSPPNPLEPGDRLPFEEALQRAQRSASPELFLAMDGGIDAGNPGAGIFALKCSLAARASGELEPWFRELWSSCGCTYAERSGTTVTAWLVSSRATLLGATRGRRLEDDDGGSFTVGSAGRVRIWGLGEPSLVRITGNALPGCYGDLAGCPSLNLREIFPGLRGLEELDLPRLALRVRKHPAGRALLAGIMVGFPGANGSSAEDLWRWLVRLVREAAEGRLDLAIELLCLSPLGRIRPRSAIETDVHTVESPKSSAAPPAQKAPETTQETPKPTPKPQAAPKWRIDPVQATPEEIPLHELFAGLLPARGLARIVGDSGAGKSTLALALAAHAALGIDFGRHRCNRAGAVAYIVNEGHHGFGLRWRALARELGPERAAAARILRVEGPVALSHAGTVRALGDQLLEAARAWTLEARPFALLVIDTQAGSYGDLAENANDHMQRFAHNLLALGEQLGALVLLVHHAHRSGGRARGASAIANAADAELFLELRGRRRLLRATKTRDGAPAEQPLPIELRVVELGHDPAGLPVRTVVAGVDEREPDTADAPEKTLDAAGFLERANGTGRELLEHFLAAGPEGSKISRRDLAEKLGIPDGTTKALLEAAVRLELLEVDPPRRGIPQRRTLTPAGVLLVHPESSSLLLHGGGSESGLGNPSIP